MRARVYEPLGVSLTSTVEESVQVEGDSELHYDDCRY